MKVSSKVFVEDIAVGIVWLLYVYIYRRIHFIYILTAG